MHFWLALRLHQKNQSIMKHFSAANQRSYHTKPGPTCRKKKKPEKRGARERTKAEAELPSKFQVKPYSLTFFFRISQNQKDCDRRLETTVQLSIVIKHLKLKVRPGFVFLW